MRKNAPGYLYIMVVAKKVMTLLQILLLLFEREGWKGRRREGVNEEVEGKGEREKNGGKRKWEKEEGREAEGNGRMEKHEENWGRRVGRKGEGRKSG